MGAYREPKLAQEAINRRFQAAKLDVSGLTDATKQLGAGIAAKKAKQIEDLNKKREAALGIYDKAKFEIQDEIADFSGDFSADDKGKAGKSNFLDKVNNMTKSWSHDIDVEIQDLLKSNPNASQSEINAIVDKKVQRVYDLGNLLAHTHEAKIEKDASQGLAFNQENAILPRGGRDADLFTVLDNFNDVDLAEDANGDFYLGHDLSGNNPTIVNASNVVKDAEEGNGYFDHVKKFDPTNLRNQMNTLIENDPRFYTKKGNVKTFNKERIKEYFTGTGEFANDPQSAAAMGILNPYTQDALKENYFTSLIDDQTTQYSDELYSGLIIDEALAGLPGSKEFKAEDKPEKPKRNYMKNFIAPELYIDETYEENGVQKTRRKAIPAAKRREVVMAKLLELNPNRYRRGDDQAVQDALKTPTFKPSEQELYYKDRYGKWQRESLSDELLNNDEAINRLLVGQSGAQYLGQNQ